MFDNYIPGLWSDEKVPFDQSFQLGLEHDNIYNIEKGTDVFESKPIDELNNIFDNPVQIKFIQDNEGNEIHEKEEIKTLEPSKITTNPFSVNLKTLNDPLPENTVTTTQKKTLGRKCKRSREERKHNKYFDDNKMRKIKSYYLKFIPQYVNSSLPPDHPKFLKIGKDVNEELKKDYNVVLMNKTLSQIFTESPINGRYSNSKNDENHNAQLVETIYRENTETEAIEKLNKTYIEVLDIMRTKYLYQFKDDILSKEIRNGEDEKTAKNYVNQLVSLLYGYESWFKDKTARQNKSTKKNQN